MASETIDTGERKEMFGYTARRVIIRTTYRYSPDDDAGSRDSEADGWYIDPPAAWRALHPPIRGHAILQIAVGGRTDTPVFTDVGPRETGFSAAGDEDSSLELQGCRGKYSHPHVERS